MIKIYKGSPFWQLATIVFVRKVILGKMVTSIRTQNKLSPKFPVNFNVSIRFCCVHYATGDAAVKAG